MSLVKQTIQHREEKNIVRKDLLQLLIQLRNNNSSQDGDWTTNIVNDGELNIWMHAWTTKVLFMLETNLG